MHTLKVGVLMGGKSIEKEVSFNSGRTVCDHLDTARYTVVPLFQAENGTLYILPWKFLHRGKISDFEHRLATEAQTIIWDDLKNLVNFVYIATHGRFAEDGTLQGFLEVLGIPYLGSDVLGSALGMDKIVQKKFLAMHGIAVARGVTLTPTDIATLANDITPLLQNLAHEKVSLPVVIKPYKEGSSLGVTIVHNEKELYPALVKAMQVSPHKKQAVLVEEKIVGMEFSCIVIADKQGNWLPLPPTEIVVEQDTDFYDYEQKYMPGRASKFTPTRAGAAMNKKIQDVCVRVSQALGFKTISRVDGFVTADATIVIVDPNTLSGMAPSSFLFREAAELNMSHTQLINHLIEVELQQYGMLEAIVLHEKKKADQLMLTKKMRVAVLMGGRTNEKEISLESGRNVTYKLSPHKYDAIPLFVSSSLELFKINQSLLVRNSTKEIEELVDPANKVAWAELPTIADFVFLGLHGGEGENGAIQGTLEMLGLPYNGSSVLASALCMDKYKTGQFLKHLGFDVPGQLLISRHDWQKNKAALIKKIAQETGFPAIVKPHDDGCSVMVQKVKKEADLAHAIEQFFAQGKTEALVEECLSGMELTVGVIGNEKAQVLPPSQVVTAGDILSIEEKFLPGAGENQTPAQLPANTIAFVQKTIEAFFTALGCKGYARIDCFYQTAAQSPTGKERLVFLELNSLPGLTPATCLFHQAAEVGIKPMDFIDLIIELGLEEHAPELLKTLPGMLTHKETAIKMGAQKTTIPTTQTDKTAHKETDKKTSTQKTQKQTGK
ncbi:hypothetical protein CVU75_01715 [Candidatus Dependentiae bacterium HGW-Dependentiae-1]|nr:MAG: hypothetical protein CVU75_01715 [Candidatus Dependentiae bacterium HGW-Dependentiae-1]